jgi:hypothetical protein
MKNIGASLKVFTPVKMKCAVVFALTSLAFVSPAFAVLRPLFPAKPTPPFSGEVIVIGDDLVLEFKKRQEIRKQSGQPDERQTSPTIKAHPIRGELLPAHA